MTQKIALIALAIVVITGVGGAMAYASNRDPVGTEETLGSFAHEDGITLNAPSPDVGFHFEIVLPYVVAELNPTTMGDVYETEGHLNFLLGFDGFPAVIFTDPASGRLKIIFPGTEVWSVEQVEDH